MKREPEMHTVSSVASFALYWHLKEAFFIQSKICNETLTTEKGFIEGVKEWRKIKLSWFHMHENSMT